MTLADRIREGIRKKAVRTKSCITSAGQATSCYMERVLHAWGIDGHNSHTNVCSAGARALAMQFWHGMDGPSPDYANARFILLLSSHLESGHYFNPHAQRIIEGKARGAKAVRGGYAALQHRIHGRLLASAVARHRSGNAAGNGRILLEENLFDRELRSPLGELGRVLAL